MLYDVTYQVGGQEHIAHVEAPDAAAAAAAVQRDHAGPDEVFELIYVHLLEEPASDDGADTAATGEDAAD
ncbi:MAG: hypothetical protein M3R02_00795 [Chloroflexota bacterium]|nr:hypothetical protein [Chloroflexota bacterium]